MSGPPASPELQASGIASLSCAGGGFGLSYKHQALTSRILNDRIQTMNDKQLKRIADAMEEILRLVKKDMENIKEASK